LKQIIAVVEFNLAARKDFSLQTKKGLFPNSDQ
jgi:hypothetical protein